MKFSINLSYDVKAHAAALLDLGFSQEFTECLQSPEWSAIINYHLAWPGDLLQVAKRARALRVLAEQGVVEGISAEETQEALYHIDCIKEEFEKILKSR